MWRITIWLLECNRLIAIETVSTRKRFTLMRDEIRVSNTVVFISANHAKISYYDHI